MDMEKAQWYAFKGLKFATVIDKRGASVEITLTIGGESRTTSQPLNEFLNVTGIRETMALFPAKNPNRTAPKLRRK